MVLTLSIGEQRLHAIVIHALPVSHGDWPDLKTPLAGLIVHVHESKSQQIVEGISKRGASCPAFPPHTIYDVIVQRHGSANTHDASILASLASFLRGYLSPSPFTPLPTNPFNTLQPKCLTPPGTLKLKGIPPPEDALFPFLPEPD